MSLAGVGKGVGVLVRSLNQTKRASVFYFLMNLYFSIKEKYIPYKIVGKIRGDKFLTHAWHILGTGE